MEELAQDHTPSRNGRNFVTNQQALEIQHVLQDSDGATAYAAIWEGQKGDTVNHQSRNGGPYFTKACNHTNAEGSSFQVLGGPQMLDAWFGQDKRRAQEIRRDYSDALNENIKE